MPWSTIAESDVLDEFSSQEQAALTAARAGTDKLPAILTRVVNSARGSILSGGSDLDAAGTIPDQIRTEVIDIARWRLLISYPALKNLQTKERKDAHDEAKKVLKEISRRTSEQKVERPATPAPTTGSVVTAPAIGCKPRKFRAGQEDGI